MVRACLDTTTHYLDITGEIPVLESVYLRDAEAQRAGIALLPAVGFDVVPSDCLALHVARRVGVPVELELAIAPSGRASAGTTRTVLASLAGRRTLGLVRRDGRLVEAGRRDAADPILRRPRRGAWSVSRGGSGAAFRTTGARDTRSSWRRGRWHAWPAPHRPGRLLSVGAIARWRKPRSTLRGGARRAGAREARSFCGRARKTRTDGRPRPG